MARERRNTAAKARNWQKREIQNSKGNWQTQASVVERKPTYKPTIEIRSQSHAGVLETFEAPDGTKVAYDPYMAAYKGRRESYAAMIVRGRFNRERTLEQERQKEEEKQEPKLNEAQVKIAQDWLALRSKPEPKPYVGKTQWASKIKRFGES